MAEPVGPGLGVNRIDDDAVLVLVDRVELLDPDEFLVDVDHVEGTHFLGDEPFFTGLALALVDIGEVLFGTKLNRNLGGDRVRILNFDNLLLDVLEIASWLRDQPLLPSIAGDGVAVAELSDCAESQGLALADDPGLDPGDDLLLNSGEVGARASEHPLISGLSLDSLIVGVVPQRLHLESLLSMQSLRDGGLQGELLAVVEWEWLGVVGLEADLLLSVKALEGLSVLVDDSRVSDDAVLSGCEDDHRLGS